MRKKESRKEANTQKSPEAIAAVDSVQEYREAAQVSGSGSSTDGLKNKRVSPFQIAIATTSRFSPMGRPNRKGGSLHPKRTLPF